MAIDIFGNERGIPTKAASVSSVVNDFAARTKADEVLVRTLRHYVVWHRRHRGMRNLSWWVEQLLWLEMVSGNNNAKMLAIVSNARIREWGILVSPEDLKRYQQRLDIATTTDNKDSDDELLSPEDINRLRGK